MDIDVADGKRLAWLAAQGEILTKRYDGNRVQVRCRLHERCVGQLKHQGVSVQRHESNGSASTEMPLDSVPGMESATSLTSDESADHVA